MRRAVVAAAVLVAVQALAADPPEELAAVRARIQELEQRLRNVVQQQSDLRQERQRLEDELELAQLKVRETEAQHDHLVIEEREAADRAQQVQDKLQTAIDRLKTQITVLAALGRAGFAPLVYQAVMGGTDVQHRVTLLRSLVRDQERQRTELANLAEERAGAVAALSQRREQVKEAADTLESRRLDLAGTRQRVIAQLATLERQRRQSASELASARQDEIRLERLWGAVQREGTEPSSDILLLRGGLPWPVANWRLIRPFGNRRDAQYGTVTISHGIYLAAPAADRVRAIADGNVVYAQFFKGFGNVVIVDHGARVYSLYANLSSILVSVNHRVAMGDPVGMTGPVGPEGSNLYLEVRSGDAPQDPLGWLRPVRK